MLPIWRDIWLFLLLDEKNSRERDVPERLLVEPMHRGINKIFSGIKSWLLVNGVRSEVNCSFQSPHKQKTSLNLLIKSTLSKNFVIAQKWIACLCVGFIFAFGLVLSFRWEVRFNPFGQRSACLRSIGF